MIARTRVQGCDGSNEFIIDLTESELAGVKKVAAASVAASDYECKPTIHVEEAKHA